MNQSRKRTRRARGVSSRSVALLAAAALLLLGGTFWAPSARAASPNVKFSGGIDKKFVNLQTILQQLLDTLERPELWGDFWNEKVSKTGRITDYRFREIAADLRKYLSDGSLQLEFRENRPTRIGTAAAQTVNANRMILFPKAGRAPGENVYGDYHLARTIFHELMHVWQYHHWTFVGRMMDVEAFPTATESKLPRKLFSAQESPDPGGAKPVPSLAQPGGVWRECEGGGREICGTWTLDKEANRFSAQWDNGAVATLKLERFDDREVVVTRHDAGGASAGLSARYVGTRDGNSARGTVTWSWKGRTWGGTWSASW